MSSKRVRRTGLPIQPIALAVLVVGRWNRFYYEVLMGFGQSEVRLVCRKQDVLLWEAAIHAGVNP